MAHPVGPYQAGKVGQRYQAPPSAEDAEITQHPQKQHAASVQRPHDAGLGQLLASMSPNQNPPRPGRMSTPSQSSGRHSSSSSSSFNSMLYSAARFIAVMSFPPFIGGFESIQISKMQISRPDLFHWFYLPSPPVEQHSRPVTWSGSFKAVLLIHTDDLSPLKEFCEATFGKTLASWSLEPQVIAKLKNPTMHDDELLERFGKAIHTGQDEGHSWADYLWWPGQFTGPDEFGFRWAVPDRSVANRKYGCDRSPCVESKLDEQKLLKMKTTAEDPQRTMLEVKHFVKMEIPDTNTPPGGLQPQPNFMPAKSQSHLMPPPPLPRKKTPLVQTLTVQHAGTPTMAQHSRHHPPAYPIEPSAVPISNQWTLCPKGHVIRAVERRSTRRRNGHPVQVDGQPSRKKQRIYKASSAAPQHDIARHVSTHAGPSFSARRGLAVAMAPRGSTVPLRNGLLTPKPNAAMSVAAYAMVKGRPAGRSTAISTRKRTISLSLGVHGPAGPSTTPAPTAHRPDSRQLSRIRVVEKQDLPAPVDISKGKAKASVPGCLVPEAATSRALFTQKSVLETAAPEAPVLGAPVSGASKSITGAPGRHPRFVYGHGPQPDDLAVNAIIKTGDFVTDLSRNLTEWALTRPDSGSRTLPCMPGYPQTIAPLQIHVDDKSLRTGGDRVNSHDVAWRAIIDRAAGALDPYLPGEAPHEALLDVPGTLDSPERWDPAWDEFFSL